MKFSMQVIPGSDASTRSKNDERLSIYERSVLRLREREQKLKKLETKLMSEYTFAPDTSLSKIKASGLVTPNREPRTPRSRMLLQKTPITSDRSISPHAKQVFLIGEEKVQCKKSSRIPSKSKLIEHESICPFPHAETVPAEVFVSQTSVSIPPLANEEQVDITAKTPSESISRVPDNRGQTEDTDCGSI